MELRHTVNATLDAATQLHEQIDVVVRELVRAANDSAQAAGGDQRIRAINVSVSSDSVASWSADSMLARQFELELVTELL